MSPLRYDLINKYCKPPPSPIPPFPHLNTSFLYVTSISSIWLKNIIWILYRFLFDMMTVQVNLKYFHFEMFVEYVPMYNQTIAIKDSFKKGLIQGYCR